MPRRVKLSDTEIAERLQGLPGWQYRAGKLHREYVFPDFAVAFAFMAGAAAFAQELNHHPDWSNVWNRVTIDLHTHDTGGVTEYDFELARRMEQLASRLLG